MGCVAWATVCCGVVVVESGSARAWPIGILLRLDYAAAPCVPMSSLHRAPQTAPAAGVGAAGRACARLDRRVGGRRKSGCAGCTRPQVRRNHGMCVHLLIAATPAVYGNPFVQCTHAYTVHMRVELQVGDVPWRGVECYHGAGAFPRHCSLWCAGQADHQCSSAAGWPTARALGWTARARQWCCE
jgi:hypothetical protein